jgi:hypothetical protein
LIIAEKLLLTGQYQSGYTLKQIIATDKNTGLKSFGYILVQSDNMVTQPETEIAYPSWGTYTGWMLCNDGCWHHGTFAWTGSTNNYVFLEDQHPYSDNYVGNEPRCMSDDQFDSFA